MAGTIKAQIQLGDSTTASNNFSITSGAADGTMKLARGNFGGTTQDVMTVGADGKVSFPAGQGAGTVAQYFGETTLTYNATQAWAADLNQVAKVTLSGSVTFSAPTGLVNGGFYSLRVVQDATGNRTAAWNSVFKFIGGSAPTLSTSPLANDFFTFRSDGTNLYEQGRAQAVS
jgi:hypothetical protein